MIGLLRPESNIYIVDVDAFFGPGSCRLFAQMVAIYAAKLTIL